MIQQIDTFTGEPFYDERYFVPIGIVAEFPALNGQDEPTFPEIGFNTCDSADFGDPIEGGIGICFSSENKGYNNGPIKWGTDIKTAGSISF